MSIYVIRYGDLLKIGFTDNLPNRVYQIIKGIPGNVATLVGHMPGDRDVEAHLHSVFAACRFSGEWFRETPELVDWCALMLIKELPTPELERVTGSRKGQYQEEATATKERLREYALQRWPRKNHAERTDALAEALGWRHSRLHGFYHGDGRAVLRSTEASQIEELLVHNRPGTTRGDE